MEESNRFALFVHHGGHLTELVGLTFYTNGYYSGVFDLHRETFNFEKLNDVVKSIGYEKWSKLWFRYPKTHNFVEIKGESEVNELLSILGENVSIISVYVEYGVDDMSGRLQKNMTLDRDVEHVVVDDVVGVDRVFIQGEVIEQPEKEVSLNERELELDLGGIDRADIDGMITQVGVDDIVSVEAGDFDGCVHDILNNIDENFGGKGGDDMEDDDDGGQSGEEDDHSENEVFFDDDFFGEGDEEYEAAKRNSRETRDEELTRLLSEFVHPYVEEDEPVSDYVDSDGDIDSEETDEENELDKHNRHKIVYDPSCDHSKLQLVVGMRFQDGWQCRSALTTMSIEMGKFVQFRKVSKTRCVSKCCDNSCPWKIHASVVKRNESFCIKTYGGDHKCPMHMSNKLLTSKWIAMRYLNVYRVRNDFSVADLRADINDRWEYTIPKDRLYKARTLAKKMVMGTVEHHYSLIRKYLAELRRVDNEGRFELLTSSDHTFKGMYIGFSSLIKGFKLSCRPLIGLDGTHLRTFLGGVLLVAVAKDGNDQMFPIVWAIVEIENEECWTWFIKCLIEDIGIGDGNGYTFISDQQKGLENAVRKLSPYAEHRNCYRHVYVNWSKTHKGTTLKNIYLDITRSTYPEAYKKHLEILKKASVDAYQDFISRDTHKFCKAFISSSCVSDTIDNNISETFNSYISNARGKHIIHMCEEIRTNLMTRQVKKLELMSKVVDSICPNIRKKLEKLRSECATCFPRAALFDRFEVDQFGNKFIVTLKDKECSCREWQISGIPCVHAVAALHRKGVDPATYVNPYFSVDRYMLAYQYGLPPLNGEQMWPEVGGFTVKPPNKRNMPGRPKKKRIRSAGEVNPKNPHKLSMKGLTMNCKRCGKPDHNKRTCQNDPIEQPPTEKRKRGRPAKPVPTGEGTSSSAASTGGGKRAAGRGTGARGGRAVGRGTGARGGRAVGRGTGARGDRAAMGSGVRGSGSTRPASTQDGTAHVMRELNIARSGSGVYIGQGTGNIYFHAPNQTTINVVHRGNLHTQGASVSGVNQGFTTHPNQDGPSTQ